MKLKTLLCLLAVGLVAVNGSLIAGENSDDFEQGTVELKSAGPLAFGPDGVLLVGDTGAASVYAIATGEESGDPNQMNINIGALDETLGAALGVEASDVIVNDLAVNPLTGTAYLSVSRGRSPSSPVVLLRIDGSGEVNEFSLKDVAYQVANIENAPAEDATDRRGRSLRTFSITDISFVDGRVVVAGLSNEEFSSKLRAIQYPFEGSDSGTSIEVYHGAHGQYETNAPVRTFAPITIDNEPFIVAAYTCTPLVKFPLSDLKDGDKLRGTTVAELGNRNNPLDMFVYEQDGAEFILMANTARGTMKISTEDIGRSEGIEERIRDKAGQTYDTIDSLQGVVQLDRLNDGHALVVIQNDDGMTLKTVKLP